MAGPLTIQRVPRGLLHALAMKGTGDLPTELAPSIVGTYDVTTLYLGDNLRSLSSATSQPLTVDAFYSAPALQVPAGEIWLPLNFTVQSAGTVGDAGNVLDFNKARDVHAISGINQFSHTGNFCGFITDTLQIRNSFNDHHDKPQITGCWLPPCNNLVTNFIN